MTASATPDTHPLLALSQAIAATAERVGASTCAVQAHPRHARSTGAVWRPGVLVTAAHALRREPASVPVILPDGRRVDASFVGADGEWRINVYSRERALLMLFLFSDVGADDAPTRIRVGSHRAVARSLASAGEGGLGFMTLAQRLGDTTQAPVECATGEAGTVYLCHPFLVHAAQPHRGAPASAQPRFVAQPPLYSTSPCVLVRSDGAYSPVETAIRRGLGYPD
jgi:hypothetical protein